MRMRRIGFLLTVFIATVAHADWPEGGKYVFTPLAINGVRLVQMLEIPSGDLCVMGVGWGNNSNGYSVQRISRSGEIAPGWPAAGVTFGEGAKTTPPLWQVFAPDDSGNGWHSFNSHPSRAQIATAGGLLVPPPVSYFELAGSAVSSHAVAAPGGDMYISSGRLHRLTRNATEAPGSPVGGVFAGTGAWASDL